MQGEQLLCTFSTPQTPVLFKLVANYGLWQEAVGPTAHPIFYDLNSDCYTISVVDTDILYLQYLKFLKYPAYNRKYPEYHLKYRKYL